jgi:hypothetical protein
MVEVTSFSKSFHIKFLVNSYTDRCGRAAFEKVFMNY